MPGPAKPRKPDSLDKLRKQVRWLSTEMRLLRFRLRAVEEQLPVMTVPDLKGEGQDHGEECHPPGSVL